MWDWSKFGWVFRFGFLVGYHNFFFSPYGSRILGGCQWWVMCVVVSRPCILSISLSHANTTQTHNINTLSFTSTHFFYNSPPPSLSLSKAQSLMATINLPTTMSLLNPDPTTTKASDCLASSRNLSDFVFQPRRKCFQKQFFSVKRWRPRSRVNMANSLPKIVL